MNAHWRAPAGLHVASARLPVEGELPSFGGATGWINSPPLTAAGLRGQVVLVDFWTYTCINWLRQLPYLRAWAGKYTGHGLVVIGVHNVAIPAAVSVFPHEIYKAPRSWAERAYPKLIYFNEVDAGCHFAAWQEPALFSSELRAAFRSLR